MAKTKFTGISECYIFDEAGGKRDQLEQAILQEFQAKKYPLQATITTIKASGGGLLGALGATREQCVVVKIDSEAQIAISNTTVGSYLYVEVYLNDLSGEVLDRLAQEGALLKQVFMTYSPDGSRLYKVIVLSSDLKEKVMYLTEDGRVVG